MLNSDHFYFDEKEFREFNPTKYFEPGGPYFGFALMNMSYVLHNKNDLRCIVHFNRAEDYIQYLAMNTDGYPGTDDDVPAMYWADLCELKGPGYSTYLEEAILVIDPMNQYYDFLLEKLEKKPKPKEINKASLFSKSDLLFVE